jgi:MazG family protein
MDLDEAARLFREFVAIVRALRTPGTGCPWDLEQTHQTLRPYLIEEAYEVLDALDRGDDGHLREELGDLLLQIVLHAQMADDRGAFAITDVIRGIAEKMVRRHPHVFEGVRVSGSADVVRNWEQIKATERQAAGKATGSLAGLPPGLPALMRAQRLGEKANKAGQEPDNLDETFARAKEALAYLEKAAHAPSAENRAHGEQVMGDLLFDLCQIARRLGVNAEDSLRAGNRRFVERFQAEENPPLPRDDIMSEAPGYVLGQSERAARRLEIQDAHFAAVSEQLLDDLDLRPAERVVELGCGPGGFSRRILRRLGAGGVLVGIDSSAGLLDQARVALAGSGPARFEPVLDDVAHLGSWLDGADVVVGRTMLHHIPMVEFVLGRLRAVVRPGTRIGFLEPDFRTPLARLAYLEAGGRSELTPLGVWATAINQLYQASRLSPDVGATLARTLEAAGYRHVRARWTETPSDALTIENMLMFYDEVRERLAALGILTVAEVERQQQLLRGLPKDNLPPAWGIHGVVCEA